MAKSTRSKVKRSFRRSKREVATSAYHAIDAARLERLSAKLRSKFDDDATVPDGDDSEVAMKDVVEGADEAGMPTDEGQSGDMPDDSIRGAAADSKKISTSGPRLSRRAEWRMSKGMAAQPNRPSTLNKQGSIKARRKSGRSHRRR